AITESFGNWENPAGLCFGSSYGCRNQWAVIGSANTIASCPGTPTQAQSAGPNCLKMTIPASSNNYINASGTFSTIPSASNANFYLWVYVTSSSIANFDAEPLLCVGTTSTCGSYAARVSWA